MAAKPLPSQRLMGGVSRQAQIDRSPDHVQEMINCTIDPATGPIKRASSRHVAGESSKEELNYHDTTISGIFYHWVNRSGNEKYVLLFTEDTGTPAQQIAGFKLSGADIGDKFLPSYVGANIRTYMALGSSVASVKLRAWTTADRSWLVNNEATPAVSGSAGIYYYNGLDTSGPPASGPLRDMNPDDVVDFASHVDHRCPVFSDLIGSQTGGIGDFTINEYFWIDFDEVGKPAGVYKAISVTTSPWFELQRTEGADGTITVATAPFELEMTTSFGLIAQPVAWNDRRSGDSQTNQGPSIFTDGKAIGAVAFYQNRLWLGGLDTLVTSRTGAAEDLWREHALLAVSSDPIDQLLTGQQVNNIQRIHPLVTGALLVLTDGSQQYEVRSSSGSFTPASTSIVATTNYDTVDLQPVSMGDRAYFVAESSRGSKLYEYYIYDQERAALVTEISVVIPGYLPKNLTVLAVSEVQEVVAFLSSDHPNTIFMLQQKFEGGERRLASWHKWDFDASADIQSCQIFGNTLYIIFKYDDGAGNGDKFYLETVDVGPPSDDAGMGDSIRLDRRVDGLTGVYTASTNTTAWTMPFRDDTFDTIVLDSTWGTSQEPGFEPKVVNTDVADVTVLTANGDYSEGTAFAGRKYTQSITLSEPHVTDEAGRNVEGALQVLRMTVNHQDTVAYDILVTAQGRDQKEHHFTSTTLGGLGALLGGAVEETGDYTVPIMASSQDTEIILSNPGTRNAQWSNIQFIVNFNPRRISRA